MSAAAALGMPLAALAMVLTPGPNMLYLVSRSIGQGPTAGLISLAGTCCGFVLYMLAPTSAWRWSSSPSRASTSA